MLRAYVLGRSQRTSRVFGFLNKCVRTSQITGTKLLSKFY